MPIQQKIFAIFIGILIFVVIIELVRRRKLKEEYAALWLLTGFVILLLASWFDLLLAISRMLGIATPIFTIFFFGIVFMVLISLHYSIKISDFQEKLKNVAQKLALLEFEQQKLKK